VMARVLDEGKGHVGIGQIGGNGGIEMAYGDSALYNASMSTVIVQIL
jgi:hypothetical protein